MTNQHAGRTTEPPAQLRGWRFVGATVLAVVLGTAYVTWKYYKHHVIFPELGPNMWIVYAIGVAGLVAWGIRTRFGTKKR
jgi:TRAP-type C4-dicarboxylate transport system permease small subunit